LVGGTWVEGWLRHMHGQPDLPHDDIMDASAGAFNALTAGSNFLSYLEAEYGADDDAGA